MANTTGQKFGGRQKGAVNKTTAQTKEIIQKVISNELDKLGAMLEQLEPKERIDAIAKLLPYILPKTSEVAIVEPELPRKILIKIPRRQME